MKVILNNIGALHNEEVECNNITLITGKNGSGKSTFGKSFCSIYDGINNAKSEFNYYFLFYSRNRIIEEFGDRNVFNHIWFETDKLPNLNKLIRATKRDIPQDFNLFLKSLFDEINNNADEVIAFIKKYRTITLLDFISEDTDIIGMLSAVIKDLINKYNDSVFYDNYICQTIREQLNYSFSGQVKNIEFNNANSSIEIMDKEFQISYNYDNNKLLYSGPISRNVFYIDNSCIIDDLYKKNYFSNKSKFVSSLQEYLKQNLEVSVNALLKIEMKNAYNEIFEIIDSVYPYDFINGKSLITSNNGIHISNEACGKKIFALIKEMLYRGLINSDSILIFDEPDNHLHPEWQIIFAKLIYMINKKIGAKVFIITHSPTLLLAFQVFSKKFNDLKVYYCDQKNEPIFMDVTNNIEKAHKELSDPYINLDMFGSSLK